MMWDTKWFAIEAGREYGIGFLFTLGATLMVHRHTVGWHVHIVLDLGLWFVEIRVGRDG